MGVWIDHLTAIIVGTVVILILAAVWYRTQVSSLSTTNTYRDRARVEVIREAVGRDMARLGSGVDAASDAILGLSWTGPARTFEFRGEIEASGTVDRIRYRATEAACDRDPSETCLDLVREQHDGTGWTASGLNLQVDTMEVALRPAGLADVDLATGVDIRVVLPAPELRPNTAQDDPRRLPVTFDRYYRLVNQALRTTS